MNILEQRHKDRARYARRRAALLCGWCEKPNTPKSLCDECLETNRKSFKKRRKTRRKNSRCAYCGKKVSAKYTQCAKCRKLHSSQDQRNLAKGLCRCGAERHRDFKSCAECMLWYRQNHKTRRDEHKAAGLCMICNDPKFEDYVYCKKHIIKNRDHHKGYYLRIGQQRRQARIDAGICTQCSLKAAKGNQLCAEHRDQMRAKNRKYYLTRKTKNASS